MKKTIHRTSSRTPQFVLRAISASLMALSMPAISATIDSKPLVGPGSTFAPHVALALSVEFPTAGAAYSTVQEFSISAGHQKQYYRGYFDNNKCYVYHIDNGNNQTDADKVTRPNRGYFKISSSAQTNSDGSVGLCNNNGKTDEFSGNLLNFMTMTALDIFRVTMTGGNRAAGTSTDAAAYASGDPANGSAFLRRANVVHGQNASDGYKIAERRLRIDHNETILKRLIPHDYLRLRAIDSRGRNNIRVGENAELRRGRTDRVSLRQQQQHNTLPRVNYRIAGDSIGKGDFFPDEFLTFFNDGFQLRIGRKAEARTATGTPFSTNPSFKSFWAYPAASSGEATRWGQALNVIVHVCDPANPSNSIESFCVSYPNGGYKPEGLLQKYSGGDTGMRFASFGYLNISNHSANGGVLRSRMKRLNTDEKEGEVVYGSEWNKNTGQLIVNPDTKDAADSGVSNSGTINYLNKFGDFSGYKTFDPGAELYYTALSYLRGKDNGLGGSAPYQQPTSTLNHNNGYAKDGFPVIYNWDDPYTRGVEPSQQHCHQNSIIFIGDTNTWNDNELPQLSSDSLVPNDPNLRTKDYLEKALANDNRGLSFNTVTGASNSWPGMVGLAYWARVNDIRPSIDGIQNSGNFLIDVLENGNHKDGRNAYYLAAKYGGFTLQNDVRNKLDRTALDQKPLPSRIDWTDDRDGSSSISAFSQGVPRNFALANNPDAMVSALEKAMTVVAASNNPSQAATGIASGSGQILDLTVKNQTPWTLQSSYNYADLSGDIVARETSYTPSNPTNVLSFKEVWRAGVKLTQAYHTDTDAYKQRQIFTIDKSTHSVIRFDENNANKLFQNSTLKIGTNAQQLAAYILGNKTHEGSLFRKRSNIMGTAINSTLTAIVPPTVETQPKGCAFTKDVSNRPLYFAAAANDGMLHIVNQDGTERLAYLTHTALPKLPDYAAPNSQHQYLNDGSPVVTNVCFGNDAKTILIGSAGRAHGAVYGLDVTDLSKPGSHNILWEFSSADDPDLGLTINRVSISNDANGKPIAIFSSGYHQGSSNKKGYIFILDISNKGSWRQGVNYWKYELGQADVGEVFVFDQNEDGKADRIFAGDHAGNLWQLKRNGTTWSSGGKALFTPDSSEARPITGAPYADNVQGKIYVTVGTGSYLSQDDLSSGQQNYAYGFVVDDNQTETIKSSDLLQQTIGTSFNTTTFGADRFIMYTVSQETFKPGDNKRGWRLQLLPGQLIASQSGIYKHRIAEFTAVSFGGTLNQQCQRPGNTSLIAVDVLSGGLHKRPVFDTNGDNLFNSMDQLAGMITVKNTTTPTSARTNIQSNSGSASVVIVDDGNNQASIRLNGFGRNGSIRISWREVF